MPEAHADRFLYERLKCDPVPATVPGSLPVLFFGDPWSAEAATIGINPSWQEFLSPSRRELDGALRRFDTLTSVGALNRSSMSNIQAKAAIDRMRGYFDPKKPVYSWFSELSEVVSGMGLSFGKRSAVHLDLVQESTDPAWSELKKNDPAQAESLMRRDLRFLKCQLDRFPFNTLICTSALVMQQVRTLLNVSEKARGKSARLSWMVSVAETPRGVVGIVGWNIPLKRATGLKRDEHQQLGKILASEMKRAGINVRRSCSSSS